jgi:sialate O-acetylesterase
MKAKVTKRRDITLPLLLSDGAVLQQKTKVRLYGLATPAERITVTLAGQTGKTSVNAEGEWELFLGPFNAGGPHVLTVQGTSSTITRKDIYFGEVWVCSGQSNMEMDFRWNPAMKSDVPTVKDPLVRMFTVEKAIAATPQKAVNGGSWMVSSPETTPMFSAVGYHFAQKLRDELGVPVGMIHTSWGGTRIEAWTEASILRANGISESEFMQDDKTPAGRAQKAARERRIAAWKAAGSPTEAFIDTGRAPIAEGWERPGIAGWEVAAVPGEWNTLGIEELMDIDGAVWFKRDFTLPADWAKNATATLFLGAIDDHDTTFINGVEVGMTADETPNAWSHPREYAIKPDVLKSGKNTLAVRVWDAQGGGGFMGNADAVYLEYSGNKLPLADAKGQWRYRIEKARPANLGSDQGANPNAASALYNAMLFPVIKYTIQGAIWYQGESNAGNPKAYRVQLPTMIGNWRKDFERPNMPFGVVQLAPWQAINPEPEDSGWAQLRDAQSNTALTMKNVGLAVITDAGDVADIHPTPKRPAGERLAYWALGTTYKKNFPASGPLFKKMSVKKTKTGNKMLLEFTSQGGALVAKTVDSNKKAVPEGKVLGFAVAGEDGKFAWAEAKIVGKTTIELSSLKVSDPQKVRFGWANYPIVNLFDTFGLPAVPFQAESKQSM